MALKCAVHIWLNKHAEVLYAAIIWGFELGSDSDILQYMGYNGLI